MILMMVAAFPLCNVSAGKQDETGLGSGYYPVIYNESNGLPTSEANTIVQSGDGFIWIGAYSGLIRYDGNEFYRFDSSTGISSVVSLYVDSKDRLWVGTNDNGIALYENGEFTFYRKEQGLKAMSIRSISEDNAGNIVIATTKGMVYIDGEGVLHTLDDERINDEYICGIERDANGVLYVDTLSGCFFTIEDLKITSYFSGPEMGMGTVICISPDPNKEGQVYLGTNGSEVIRGNIRNDMKDYEVLSVAPQQNINDITPMEDGTVWICSDNGIGYLTKNDKFVRLQNIPIDNSVDSMMVDFEGNLWFTSSRQGVMKIADSLFTDVSVAAGLDSMVVNTTCIYQDDLYIGSDEGLYLIDKNYKQKENAMTELLAGIRIRCINGDSAGNLWFCTYSDNGLVCYHGDGSYTLYNEETGLKSNRVRCMTELSDGTIAVATSGGVNLIKNGVITAEYDEENGISNTEILSLCEGDDGALYMGSDGNGIFVLKDGEITSYGLDDGLASEVILRMKKDPYRPVYWIVTSNSIAYMQDGKITTIRNFPYSNNFDMYFNESGTIWVLSGNGIYVVNGEELLEDKEPEYLFYDTQSGLPSAATANSRSYLAEDGTLYISCTTGVSSVNIREGSSESGDVKLLVPFIEADGEMIQPENGKEFKVPSGCKRLTIYGYALTYALNNPRVSYYLEGFDEDTVSVSKQDMEPVSYTNLPGGKYVFHLSVINAITGEVENTIAVTIEKEKALYEQVWFWVALAVLAVAVILCIVRFYTKRKTEELLRKQEENRIFISQIIHAFAKTIDLKDKYTNGHSFRVAEYAKKLSERMGYDAKQAENVYNIALLHDIGKITISSELLNKSGKLTDEEYNTIKQHAENGYNILKEIEISPELALGAGFHHERMDGKGYPSGKAGDEIPMVAQIIAVADTFDAMNSTRPYRKQMKMEDIVAELKRVSGTQLNSQIVEHMLKMIEEGVVGQEKE